MIGVWLWLAWANGQGRDWARPLSAVSFMLITVSMMAMLTQDAAVVAPADVIAAAAEWILALASVVLIFTPAACRYYQSELARL
jgi:hypothetical protein